MCRYLHTRQSQASLSYLYILLVKAYIFSSSKCFQILTIVWCCVCTGRRSWSKAEQTAVLTSLGSIVRQQARLPGKAEIIKCMTTEPILQGRSWKNIKDFCRNRNELFW